MANTGTMTIAVTNSGPTADQSAVIRDNLTTGFSAALIFPATFAVTYGGGASGPATITPATLTAGFPANMPVGGTVSIIMPFTTAVAVTNAVNTATVTSSLPGGDANLGNNSSTITATITPQPVVQTDLAIVKTINSPTYDL